MKTPNIDRLAASSVLFEHHRVSVPICSASRAGLPTGTRSQRTRPTSGGSVWPRVTGIRTVGRTCGAAGYYPVSLGKVWHTMRGSDVRFCYIEWHEGREQTDRPVAVELYDYSPGAPGESRNLADEPALTDQCDRQHALLWNGTPQSTITHK